MVAIMFYVIHVRQMALRFALLDMAILTSQLEIKQWGRHADFNPGTFKLPIAYSSALYAVVVTTNDNENVATTNAAYNYTNSGFDFRDNHQIAHTTFGK